MTPNLLRGHGSPPGALAVAPDGMGGMGGNVSVTRGYTFPETSLSNAAGGVEGVEGGVEGGVGGGASAGLEDPVGGSEDDA